MGFKDVSFTYQGAWDPSTNTPPIVNSSGRLGEVYSINGSGIVDLGGGSQFYNSSGLLYHNGSQYLHLSSLPVQSVVADPSVYPSGQDILPASITGDWLVSNVSGIETETIIRTWEGTFVKLYDNEAPHKLSNQISRDFTSINIDRDAVKSWIDTDLPSDKSTYWAPLASGTLGGIPDDIYAGVWLFQGFANMWLGTKEESYIETALDYFDVFRDRATTKEDGYLKWAVISGDGFLSEVQWATGLLWMCYWILKGPFYITPELEDRALDATKWCIKNVLEYQLINELKANAAYATFILNWGSGPSDQVWSDKVTNFVTATHLARAITGWAPPSQNEDYAYNYFFDTVVDSSDDKIVWDIGAQNFPAENNYDAPDVFHASREPLMIVTLYLLGFIDRVWVERCASTFKRNIWNGKDTGDGTGDGDIRLVSYIDGTNAEYGNTDGSPHSTDGHLFKQGFGYYGWPLTGLVDPLVQHILYQLYLLDVRYSSNVSFTYQRNTTEPGRLMIAGTLLMIDQLAEWKQWETTS